MDYEKFKEEYDESLYGKVENVLKNDYSKLLECFHVWVDVNRYYDVPEPENCRDFHDWNSLINCVIENTRHTQHLFEFNL